MSARDWALFELDYRRLPGWSARLLRGRPPQLHDPRDFALGEQIVFGVVKNVLLLQHLIEFHSGRSMKSIDPLVQKIIAIGLYQLRFLTRIPASAAVNQAVEQTKRYGRAKGAGFVNAVLRKMTRDDDPPLPNRIEDPAGYAHIALSHPRELFDQLSKLLGPTEAVALCEHDNREPPTIVRLIPPATLADLQTPGVTLSAHMDPGMVVVESARKAVLADWARKGLAQVQDPTAAAVVKAMQCEPGQRVLDRCAGLGTKTLQLREAVGAEGYVVAIDPNLERCRGLEELVAFRHIGNVAVHPVGMMKGVRELQDDHFDRILIDAPCSNSGVLARRPEARFAQGKSAVDGLRNLQDSILDDTARHLREGGLMVYSTCSIWPEENERRIERFLQRWANFTFLRQLRMLPSMGEDPGRYHDGGYIAVLRHGEAARPL